MREYQTAHPSIARVTGARSTADFPHVSLPGARVRCLLEPICSSARKLARGGPIKGSELRCRAIPDLSARCPRGGDRPSAAVLESATLEGSCQSGSRVDQGLRHRCNHSSGRNPFPRSREYLRIVFLRRQLLFQGSRYVSRTSCSQADSSGATIKWNVTFELACATRPLTGVGSTRRNLVLPGSWSSRRSWPAEPGRILVDCSESWKAETV